MGDKINIISDYKDAEIECKRWFEDKFPKANNIIFNRVGMENNVWNLEGEVSVPHGFDSEKKGFYVKITSDGDIVQYEIITMKK
jgi:hypothetical protein